MQYIGTQYGGWWIPADIHLNKTSIVYSGGIGEDMSFDVNLQSKYGCTVICIDPTQRAVTHYEQLKQYYETGKKNFTGDIQKDYFEHIENKTPDFNKLPYLDIGLWDSSGTLRFYKQENEQYVSQSLVDGMFSGNYDEVQVDTIPNIMKQIGHDKIDLLKLDIEGAEPRVLKHMFSSRIFPKYVLVEFDLYLKNKDSGETKEVVEYMLQNGYRILKNDKMNITFVYK